MRLAGERVGRSTTPEPHCASWLSAGGNPRRPAAKPRSGGMSPARRKGARVVRLRLPVSPSTFAPKEAE